MIGDVRGGMAHCAPIDCFNPIEIEPGSHCCCLWPAPCCAESARWRSVPGLPAGACSPLPAGQALVLPACVPGLWGGAGPGDICVDHTDAYSVFS